MTAYDLLFSRRPAIRYTRHILFWTVRLLYLLFIYHARVYWLSAPGWLNWAAVWKIALIELAGEMALVYAIVYWLLPVYFRRKNYLRFLLGVLFVVVAVFVATYPNQSLCLDMAPDADPYFIFWNCLMSFSRVTLATCLVFLAIRMFKRHYARIRERETLHQETARLEFQLLKAQVHPHFLFNTLNNIYSFALNRSPRAGELLSQLSDIMRYMIHDCEADRMPLDRELKMLQDYIGLEKARYGDRLDIQVDIQGDHGHRQMAPLLMIPFIENCFKHGASQVLEKPWVRLQIVARANQLDFRLSNSKPLSGSSVNGKNGIGLRNIKQRLELLYHGQYQLEIDSTADTFSVHMVVPLEEEGLILPEAPLPEAPAAPIRILPEAPATGEKTADGEPPLLHPKMEYR